MIEAVAMDCASSMSAAARHLVTSLSQSRANHDLEMAAQLLSDIMGYQNFNQALKAKLTVDRNEMLDRLATVCCYIDYQLR